MKKLLFFFAVLLLFSFSGCSDAEDDVVVVTERFFVTQMIEIIINRNDFMGRTIQMEGLFREFNGPTRDFYIVMRYAVCCEAAPLGFEVILDGIEPLPNDTWVKVVGSLDMQGGALVLVVSSLTELDERGAVYVS